MAPMSMPAPSSLGAVGLFLGMWAAMTAAMMLPSFGPMLWRYRRAVGAAGPMRREMLTTIVGIGYFAVWMALGVLAFPLARASVALGRTAPIATGVVVLLAGAWQLTSWKAHHLACCRMHPARACARSHDARAAWRLGVRHGLDCARCCGNLMAIPLVVGLMDARAMLLVGAAIAIERLAPAGARLARVIGIVVLGAGVSSIVRAIGGA
jgi:predicted metal-binding membrane protein